MSTETFDKFCGLIRHMDGSLVCGAGDRGHACGPCRACWSTKVKNVTYLFHQ